MGKFKKHNSRYSLTIAILLISSVFILNTTTVGFAIDIDNDLYKKRTEWYPARGTHLNVSHYIYHDINRNGIYDIEDKPIVKIAVKMTRPDGTSIIKRSNLNGFVNFTNSMTDSPVDVSEPGEYTFEVIVPEGWEITSNNKVQKITYKESKETRSSLIADRVPTPVGLIQVPQISGKICKRDKNKIINVNSQDVDVKAIAPSGEIQKVPLDEHGNFTITGEYGKWRIRVKDNESGMVYERIVNLDTIPVKMSTIILGDPQIENKPNTEVIDFENITYSTIQKIPNGVGGLNWSNLIVTDNLLYGGEGYKNITMSGKYVGYNTSGYPVTISNENGFDFYGGYFGVAWMDSAEGEILKVRVWRENQLISEEEYSLSALGPFWFDANYKNITKLEISTEHYWQFVVDDILIGID